MFERKRERVREISFLSVHVVSSPSIYHCSSARISSGKTDVEGQPPFPVIVSVLVSAPSLCIRHSNE